MKQNPLHALILCNGEPPSPPLARRLAAEADYIVAADGGANAARRLGIRPRTIIGDLDSLSAATRKHFASSLIIRVRRQDNTDLEKALDFILAQGIRSVVLTGITGRRIDFTLANLSVLWRYSAKIDIRLAGDGWQGVLVRRSYSGKAPKGTTVSIIPFGECRGVTLTGLKYPLRNATLGIGKVGVSNVVTRARFSVRVKRGRLIVFRLEKNIPSGHGK